ncbi:NUDIX hydrolase [Nesterenkonia ebinurensis]|uniref:NUDIX hydrolase n=1 Tax=Nesterenkonia ebinurensis TaxID=2608252 RepID=UPI00123D172A|nr:NUDIX domain-containing protein [Nesterenkonia ebinurensis]
MAPPAEQKTVTVAAVIILDRSHRVLTVRKRGTQRFMQPGGKPEPGESAPQTALREVAEEIGLTIAPYQLTDMGEFTAPAANESDTTVVCRNFLVKYDDAATDLLNQLQPAAEIAQLRWIPLAELAPAEDLAPLLTDQVAPAVCRLLEGSELSARECRQHGGD